MSLTLDDVQRIARLARLAPDAAQQQTLLTQLNGFFDIVEQMRAVDTTGVEPLHTPLAGVSEAAMDALRLRDDVASEPIDRALNQRSAPHTQAGLYLVPKVIE